MSLRAGLLLLSLVGGIAGGILADGSGRSGDHSGSGVFDSLHGLKSQVYVHPTNLPTLTPCDSSLDYDLGCNYWWMRDDYWAVYLDQQQNDFRQIGYSLGQGTSRAGLILLFNLFLADPSHGGAFLARLDTVITDITAAGLEVILFFGRPEYYGVGNTSQQHDVMRDAAARAYLLDGIASTLARPVVQRHVTFTSLYWLGGSWVCSNCTPAEVANFTQTVTDTVHAAGSTYQYLQHVDGPFWDGCWPQPCTTWDVHGYGPVSLNGTSDGLLAESWVQGSLEGGVRMLLDEGVIAKDTLLLLTDVPNCDLYPTSHPCSSGSLAGDVSEWWGILDRCGVDNTTWGVWDSIDGSLDNNDNYYGDVLSNGTGLTAKGLLHRARAMAG